MTGSIAERQFEVLARTVSEMVWIYGSDGAWDYVNPRWCEYTGFSLQDSIGFGWRQVVHHDDLPNVQRVWRKIRNGAEHGELECRIRGADFHFCWFTIRIEPIGDERWLATAARVTSRPAITHGDELPVPGGAERAPVYFASGTLCETEDLWRFALESADLGAWELDLASGEIWRSERYDKIFGYEQRPDLWTYDTFLQHVIEEDRARVNKAYIFSLCHSQDWIVECRIHRNDNEIRWIRASGRAVADVTGQSVKMWGVIEDTTERKLTEQALRDREAHFRSLANTAPAMLWVTNVDHLCTFISRAWCFFTGQTLDESLGDRWANSIHSGDRARVQRTFLEAAHERRPFQVEYRLRTAGGEYRWVLDSGRARFTSKGAFLGYVGSVTDVHDMKEAKEEQQRTAELLHAVIETTQDCVYVKDIEGRMRMANPAALCAIGKPAEMVIGHSDLEWLDDPEQGARIEANDLRIMERGTTEVVEEWMSTPDGCRLFLATKSPLRNEAGQVVGLVGISRDVTEQKRAEQQVLESESRMRRLFDNTPANITIFEGAEHRCVYVNQSQKRFMEERACLGLTAQEGFAEFASDDAIKRLNQAFQNGEALITPRVESASTRAGRHVFHETIQPWLHEDGSVAGVMVMAFNITEEVGLRRQVEESEARFRALADNIAQLAWMADERGRIFWYNRRWLDYTGTTFKDMQNARWRNVHHPDHAQRVIKKVNRCLRTGEALEDTFPLRGGNGQYRWFYSQAIPIRDETGNVTRWFGTHTDVTEQREAAQALEEADRRKNEFLAMLAHELRNPLAPVRYAVEILRNVGGQDDTQTRARDTIDRQVAHMARLIDDLLDVSRITRGKIELRREHCDLANIVRKTVAEYRFSLEATGIFLSCEVPDYPLWLNGDPTRLVQVIGNLLHNAGKFTEPGGAIDVALSHEAGNCAILKISDTGVGIEKKLLSQLFEPFSQAAQTLDRSKGGLGLGLSLVKGLVELHGGSVRAESDGPGRGSAFFLRLPLLAMPHKIAEKPVQPYIRSSTADLKVLIIEDNRDTAESLSTLLQMEGHKVNVAYDGPSGVELARTVQPDVVLCDVGLPGGMDGYQVVRSIRADQTMEPHLFALSGYGQNEDRRQAREAGFHRHFVKPVDYRELSEALAMASDARQAFQQEY
jgi:PAS domain S-box-containing protein